jgi:hypothetical protein
MVTLLILLVPVSVITMIIWDAINFGRPRSDDDPLARYTKWLGVFTGALALATIVSAIVLWKTDTTLQETLIASNRAWLHLEHPIKANETASGLIYFGNVGHAAATNVGHHSEGASVAIGSYHPGPPEEEAFRFRDAIHALQMPDSCEIARKQRFAGVVYPLSSDSETKPATVGGKWVTSEIENGGGFLVIKGCLTYETMGEAHSSKYCFIYNPKVDAMRPAAHQGWWMSCVTDNEAD